MTTRPPADWFSQMARVYKITVEEANQRYDALAAWTDDPAKPICIGCAKTPDQIDEYVMCGEEEGITATQYVVENEGTLNRTNGHFLCDSCYIINGQPSSPTGWVAP